jgi:outer membrane receptor for ferrienterochelin and colicins
MIMKKIILIFIFSVCFAYSKILSGYVYDENTNEPLAGASVRVQNTNYGAYTNSSGFFEIKGFQSDTVRLMVSMLSYKTKLIKITKYENEVIIRLKEQPIITSEVIVSANKRVQAVQEIPISVSVINSDEIEIRNITRIDEAIRYVPGVEVNQDNISIRGSSGFSFGIGSRASLLVDGFPLISGDNGDVNFDALPLYNIERIEVVKGAGSALYGTSALGGVINIITSEPKPETEFKARVYSGVYTKPRYSQWNYSDNLHHQSGVNANFSKKINKLGFNLGGSYLFDESWQEYRDEEKISFNGKLNYEFNDYSKLHITSNINLNDRADWVYWESLNLATFPPIETDESIRINSSQLALYSNFLHIINDDNFFNFKAGILRTDFNNSYFSSDSEYRQSQADNINLELQMNSNLTKNHLLTYGLNYLNNNVKSSTYGNQTQQIFSAYAQSEYKGIERFILNIGGRFDYENVENLEGDLQISPKIGVSYRINEFSGIRFSGGTGFRTPAVAERFASVSFQGFDVIANTELKPERSFSVELGYNLEYSLSELPFYFDFSVFNNEFYDLIEPGFVNQGSTIQFQNLTRARITGSEINIKTLLFGFIGLESALTYLNPVDVNTNELLKYRSEFISHSGITLPVFDFNLRVDYRYKSKVENIDNRLALQIKDYDARVPLHLLDLAVSLDYP